LKHRDTKATEGKTERGRKVAREDERVGSLKEHAGTEPGKSDALNAMLKRRIGC
jgi:hypothetical protein